VNDFPKTPAARLALLLDLYAPEVERDDGTIERDPSLGIISLEQIRELLDTAAASGLDH
jgi:hypothetical protein